MPVNFFVLQMRHSSPSCSVVTATDVKINWCENMRTIHGFICSLVYSLIPQISTEHLLRVKHGRDYKGWPDKDPTPQEAFSKVGRSNMFHNCDQSKTEHLPFERCREKTKEFNRRRADFWLGVQGRFPKKVQSS